MLFRLPPVPMCSSVRQHLKLEDTPDSAWSVLQPPGDVSVRNLDVGEIVKRAGYPFESRVVQTGGLGGSGRM